MAAACGVCGEAYETREAGQRRQRRPRRPKVLPCGHTACLPCLEEHARGSGKLCPVCRKLFRSEPADLADNQALMDLANMTWCVDCDAVAAPRCFELHALCGLRRLEREAAAELALLRAERAAVLRGLHDDVLREEAELEGLTPRDLPGLRRLLAAARAHPLRLLAGERPLHRALAAVQREKTLEEREAAINDREAAVNYREASIIYTEATVKDREAFIHHREATVKDREATVDEREAFVIYTEASVNDRETSINHREAAVNDREAAFNQIEATVNYREANVNHRGADVNDKQATCKVREATTINYRVAAVNREATVNDREASVDKEAAVNEREATVNVREAAVNAREAAVNDGEATVNDREATVNDRGAVFADWQNTAVKREVKEEEEEWWEGEATLEAEASVPDEMEAIPKWEVDPLLQSPFDALPDCLLELVLANVPARQPQPRHGGVSYIREFRALLSLRLVCLRWSRLVLSPAVWRHRRVELYSGAQTRLMRVVPALDSLTVSPPLGVAGPGFSSALSSARIKEMTHHLGKWKIEVRSLRLDVEVTLARNKVVGKFLNDRRATLKELVLRIGQCYPRASARTLLAALDSPSVLEALTIERREACELDHHFHRLVGLRKLVCRGKRYLIEKTERTYRSLVTASKDALLEVDCGEFDLLQQLAQCTRLRAAVVNAGDDLRKLCERPQLQSLRVWCREEGDTSLLRDALEHSRPLPARISVVLCVLDFASTLLQGAACLSRVHRLELNYVANHCSLPRRASTVRVLLEVFEAMTLLEELVVRRAEDVDWEALLRGWGPGTLPALRAVHVECRHFKQRPGSTKYEYCLAAEEAVWLRGLKALRPQLVTTTCPAECFAG